MALLDTTPAPCQCKPWRVTLATAFEAWLGARPVKEGPLLRRWVNPPPDAAQGVREGGYRQVHGALSPHFRQPSQAKGR